MKLASKTISIRALMPFVVLGLAVLLVPGGVFAQAQTIARNDSAITPPNTSVDIEVLNNDTPGSGSLDRAGVTVITPPDYALSLTYDGNGTFTYTPNADAESTEPDTFVYEVCDDTTLDPEDACDTATVSVYVGTQITTFNIIPKKLNVKKNGVIPVVIRSIEGFEVTEIVPESLRLEGVEPDRVHVGEKKITLKFKAQDIVGPFRNDVVHGDEIVLHLTGRLINELDPLAEGPVIVGEDTVIIIKKGKQN